MRIDDRIEELVRDALDAVVKRDSKKFEAALKAFPDDRSVQDGVQLALAVCTFVLADMYEGKPNAAQIRELAEKVAEMERWAAPTVDEIDTFLSKLLSGRTLADLPVENIIVLAFVVTASLLSSVPGDDEEWWNYLDRAEAAIEAASQPRAR